MVGVAEDADASEAEQAMRTALANAHQVHPDDRRAFGSYNTAEKFQRLQNLFQGVQVLFGWSVSRALGAIGVSNILLIVVRERTAEIGLRRAIGGTRRYRTQHPAGGALLTSFAGYLAIVVGAGRSRSRTVLDPEHPILAHPPSSCRLPCVGGSPLSASAGYLPRRHETHHRLRTE